MFVRRKNNRSGTISIHVIDKSDGGYTIVKSFGTAKTVEEAELLESKARLYLKEVSGLSQSLFEGPTKDSMEEVDESAIENKEILYMGPELFFGEIYNRCGLSSIENDLLRHLVLSRLSGGISKAKAASYLKASQGKDIKPLEVYEAVDKLASSCCDKVLAISSKNPGNAKCYYVICQMPVVASDTVLRLAKKVKAPKKAPSKSYIGVLITYDGALLGYDVISAKVVKSARVISLAEKAAAAVGLSHPVIVADSTTLSKATVKTIKEKNIEYILSEKVASLKTEELSAIVSKLSSKAASIDLEAGYRLVATRSENQAAKDALLREEGLSRLQKKIDAGTLKSITNRGYSKLLSMSEDGKISVDADKVASASKLDGILLCSTNMSLQKDTIISIFSNVEQMEKAFQISKTDYAVKPFTGKIKDRVDGHALVCFASLLVRKELEKVLSGSLFGFSYEDVRDLCAGVYQLRYTIPGTKMERARLLEMTDAQKDLYSILYAKV